MFGRFMKDFDEDPFFSGFGAHRDVFESMGGSRDPFLALADGKGNRRNDREGNDRRVSHPYGGFFQSMNSMMSDMHRHMADLEGKADGGDPNVHSFSSSTVMSYRNDGKSEPKYYQASTSTRSAPGNVKETRRTLRDSETGIDKMAIGHHIGDKGRVVERRRNNKANETIEEKNYYHMDEDEEQDFENEWRKRTTSYNLDYGRPKPARGLAAPKEKHGGAALAPKKRPVKTPAVAVRGSGIEPSRPRGPGKSGRHASKY